MLTSLDDPSGRNSMSKLNLDDSDFTINNNVSVFGSEFVKMPAISTQNLKKKGIGRNIPQRANNLS